MSDLISRADAICEVLVNDGIDNIVDRINALPSAELPKGDLISRADVLKYPIRLDHYDEVNGDRVFVYGVESVIEYVESLPSAELTVWTPQTYGKSINPSNAEVVEDYISRADAIEAVYKIMPIEYRIITDKTMQLCDREELVSSLMALPSAETHEIRTETHGVCLISKDDAMGAVQDHFNDNGFKGYDDGQKMMDRINALPSADRPQVIGVDYSPYRIKETSAFADRPQGEWIFRTDIPIGNGRSSAGYVCSICGKDYFHGDMLNYCPNCGARMESK